MELRAGSVSPAKDAAENDSRAFKHWTVRPDDSAAGNGWMWIGAIVVAALFIVSGYLDHETGYDQESSPAVATNSSTSSGSVAPTSVASTNASGHRADKGY